MSNCFMVIWHLFFCLLLFSGKYMVGDSGLELLGMYGPRGIKS